MNIRIATVEDLDAIVGLSEKMMDFHCDLDPYYGIYREYDDSEEFYQEELGRKDRMYVIAYDENKPVGFASASFSSIPDAPVPAIGTLITNFVLPEYRNQGIGTKFHNIRMEWLQKHKVKHVEMSVDTRNTHAVQIWKKKGFKEYQLKLRKDL